MYIQVYTQYIQYVPPHTTANRNDALNATELQKAKQIYCKTKLGAAGDLHASNRLSCNHVHTPPSQAVVLGCEGGWWNLNCRAPNFELNLPLLSLASFSSSCFRRYLEENNTNEYQNPRWIHMQALDAGITPCTVH